MSADLPESQEFQAVPCFRAPTWPDYAAFYIHKRWCTDEDDYWLGDQLTVEERDKRGLYFDVDWSPATGNTKITVRDPQFPIKFIVTILQPADNDDVFMIKKLREYQPNANTAIVLLPKPECGIFLPHR